MPGEHHTIHVGEAAARGENSVTLKLDHFFLQCFLLANLWFECKL